MPSRGAVARVSRALFAIAISAVLTVAAVPALGAPGDLVDGVPVSDGMGADASPEVTIPAGVLWTEDGRALWERRPDDRRPMASITKIMTALVVLEETDLSETVTVSPRAASVGEAGVDLVAGQRLSVRELLEATLVRSANDAAFALAEHTAGSVDAFVARMNDRASELGLRDTSFANPHGLDAPGHHTSAHDLATLARTAMADERFAEIVRMEWVTITGADGSERYENSNVLIGSYGGATGVKTGWTNRAGYCVVASAERDGVGMLAVVLGAASERDRFVQAEALLDWGFDHYRLVGLTHEGETAALVPVADLPDTTVAAVVAEDLRVPVFDVHGPVTSHADVRDSVRAPIRAGERLGTLSLVQDGVLLGQVPLVAEAGVEAPSGWEAVRLWIERARRVLSGETYVAPAIRYL